MVSLGASLATLVVGLFPSVRRAQSSSALGGLLQGEDEGQGHQEGEGEEREDVHEGQVVALADHLGAHEALGQVAGGDGIRSRPPEQPGGEGGEPGLGGPAGGGDVLGQPGMVELGPVGQDRRGYGDAHAAALVAHEVVDARSLALLGQGHPDHAAAGQHHDGEAHADAVEDSGQDQEGDAGLGTDVGQEPGGPGQAQHPCHQEHLPVDPPHQHARSDHRHHGGHPSGTQHDPGPGGREAQHVLHEQRQDDERGVEAEVGHEGEQHAARELGQLEQGEVHEGIVRGEAAPDEEGEPQGREPGIELHLVGREPVQPLAAVEEELQAAQAHGDAGEAPAVDAALGLRQVGRILQEGGGQEEGHQAHRHVDPVDPGPAPVVRDPAAHQGAEDGAEDHADGEDRRGHALLLLGEGLHGDGLAHGHHGAAGEPLDDPEEDLGPEARREAAGEAGQGEGGQAEEVEALAPEVAAQPARDGQDDGVGHQVAGDDPGDLLGPGGVGPLHVGQGDVHHRGVEHLHEGAQHRGERDDPLQVLPAAARHGLQLRVSMVTVTERPRRRRCSGSASGASRILTGSRWTTFTQLPVAFSAGSRLKTLPVPAERLSTVPAKDFEPSRSVRRVTCWPGCTRASWVSL